MRQRSEIFESRKAAHIALWILLALVVIAFFGSFFVGYAGLSFTEVITGLFQKSNDSVNRIMLRLRLPRTLAAFLIGGGLGLAGLMMQTALENPMASPVTLGVSNAATFGANLFLLIFFQFIFFQPIYELQCFSSEVLSTVEEKLRPEHHSSSLLHPSFSGRQ